MRYDLRGTRREVIGGLAALAGSALWLPRPARAQDEPDDCSPVPTPGTPVPYQPNTALPVRVRKSVFELSSAEINRLQAAYAALRTLTANSPNDPRGWLRQGYVHCWYCGGGSGGEHGPEIHGGWTFFPWHRAFLHFHERILCKLIGDDTFALPYWDWDSTGRDIFPSVYGNPGDPSSLADQLRGATVGAPMVNLCITAGDLDNTMGQPSSALFMGDASTSGAMENSPHGPVHIWTGDPTLQTQAYDMGVLATAAQDPVFFAHHGNIDRLWSVWLGLGSCQQNPTDQSWLQTAWQFYDENQVWTEITIAQVLDMENSLQTTYQAPSAQPLWTPTPCPAPTPTRSAARPLAAAAPAAPLALLGTGQPPLALAGRPVSRTVRVPAAHRQLFRLKAQNRLDRLLVLRLSGITVPGHRQAMFRVFLNLPSANSSTSTASPNFVGTVTILAKSKRHAHGHRTVDAAFDVSALLGTQAARSQLAVTLVPVTGRDATAAAPNATIAQITLEQR